MAPFIFKIPPLLEFLETQKITASDGVASDALGYSCAIDGLTAVICTRVATVSGFTGAGAGYIYEKIGNTWTEVQKITSSVPIQDGNFGTAIAIFGNTIVVTATGENTGFGATLVFEKAGTWPTTETQRMSASDANLQSYGFSCAIDNTTIIIGAYGAASTAGAAYIYEKGTTWPATETQQIVANDTTPNAGFGRTVAIEGNILIAGAFFDDPGGIVNSGSAYIFEKSGTWTQVQKIIPSDPDASASFGIGVGISGTTVCASAWRQDVSGIVDAGKVYVYEKAGTWPTTETQALTTSVLETSAQLGFRLDMDGDIILASAYSEDAGGLTNSGAVYLFKKAGTWPTTETQRLISSQPESNGNFGSCVSISGNALIIGSNGSDDGGIVDAGAGFIFER